MSITLEELPAWLNGIVENLEQPHAAPALKEWLDEFVGEIGRGIDSSAAQIGQAWAPLEHPDRKGRRPTGRSQGETHDLVASAISNSSSPVEQITDDAIHWSVCRAQSTHQKSGAIGMSDCSLLNVTRDQTERAAELVAQQIIKNLGMSMTTL
jgi:hypothetical protein